MSEGAKYISEFTGTYLLVFTVGCNVLGGAGVWAATSIACVLMVSIYALGGVSGAHFNPAVTVALQLAGKTNSWGTAGAYIGVQLLGGILAGFSYFALFGKTFNLAPNADAGFGWWEACLVEVLYTFMLCFVVLNVAATKATEGNQYYGLAIGFVIVPGGYAGGGVSAGPSTRQWPSALTCPPRAWASAGPSPTCATSWSVLLWPRGSTALCTPRSTAQAPPPPWA